MTFESDVVGVSGSSKMLKDELVHEAIAEQEEHERNNRFSIGGNGGNDSDDDASGDEGGIVFGEHKAVHAGPVAPGLSGEFHVSWLVFIY